MNIIDLFINLDINKKNLDFEKFLFDVKQSHVFYIIQNYLEEITMSNMYINTKDFISLLTINKFNNEFILNNEEKEKIKLYLDNYEYINNNKKHINIHTYYLNNIQILNKEIKEILDNILSNTLEKVKKENIKMYYFYNNLYNEYEIMKNNIEIKQNRDNYYKLIKNLELDTINIDELIKKKIEEYNFNELYEKFRKDIFFDMLKKDLLKNPPKYDCIIYLLDIIRIKLNNIAPQKKSLNHIKININNILDIKYIKQRIDNNVFDFDNILNIFNFILKTLKDFIPSDWDKKIKIIEDDIKTNIYIKKIEILLPNIMYNLLDITEELEKLVLEYRNNMI